MTTMNYNELQQQAINSTAEKVVVTAPAGSGKALKNNTGVLTPNGYKSIGDIKIGDTVFDGNGYPTLVSGVYPQGKKQIYRVTFSNGHTIDCCEDHLWQFQTKFQRDADLDEWTVKTTKEILNTVSLYKEQVNNIYLPMYDYIEFCEQPLSIEPYTFGCELGKNDMDSNTSFIPKSYLFNTLQNRCKLLRGLINGNEVCAYTSYYTFTTKSKQLSEDITFLCESLGYVVKKYCDENIYVINIYMGKTIAIIGIKVLDEYADMTCITVVSNTHTFVIEHGIVTHNTTVLVGAIKKYHEENPEDTIVAITFTRKAAAELGSRTFGLSVETSTIHSWSLRELNKLGVKYKFKVSLLQDEQIQEILRALSRKCGYYTMNNYILFSYVMGNYNIDVPQSTKQKYEKVLRAYIEYKRNNKLYDFTDLPLYLYDMLEEYNEVITTIDGLFVDEFQDVDEIQAKIFTKVIAKKYFYIGDERQMIYAFRIGNVHNLSDLIGFEHHDLLINYRSYQGIIDFATTMRRGKFISDTLTVEPSDIICSRTDEPGDVYIITSNEECYDVINNTELDVVSTLTAFLLKRPYILCRSNKQVKQIQSLGYNNVSTVHQAKGLEYSNVILTDMALSNEEEVNIAYVGCTRAQNGLLVCDPTVLYLYMSDILYEYKDEICGGKLF